MQDFHDTHRAYLDSWEDALATGDASPVEAFLAADYHGWFCPDAASEVPYGRDEAVEGMTQSVGSLRGATLHAVVHTLAPRGDGVVVVYDKSILREGERVAASLIVESWARRDDRWVLVREVTEHGAASGAESGEASRTAQR